MRRLRADEGHDDHARAALTKLLVAGPPALTGTCAGAEGGPTLRVTDHLVGDQRGAHARGDGERAGRILDLKVDGDQSQ